MRILAFDTSGIAGSVALLEGDRVLAARSLDPARRSAQTLAPALAEVLFATGLKPADVRLVATTTGPGSFTGLRIGVTAAKTFAYAAGCDLIGLNTLDVIAAQARGRESFAEQDHPSAPTHSAIESRPLAADLANPPELHAVIDAQRKELFLARYCPGPGGPKRLAADTIIAAQTWLDTLAPGTIVTGSGLEKLESRLPPHVIAVATPLREPQAVTIGQLAWREYQSGRRDDLWKLAPAYLRPSYAEEKASATRNP